MTCGSLNQDVGEVREKEPEDSFNLAYVLEALEIAMTSTPTRRVSVTHHHRARVPGGFQSSDEEMSPVKIRFNGRDLPYSPTPSPRNDDGLLHIPEAQDGDATNEAMSMLDESEMGRKLMDVESSFLPEISPIAPTRAAETNDTSSNIEAPETTTESNSLSDEVGKNVTTGHTHDNEPSMHQDNKLRSSTPSESYQTPASVRDKTPAEDATSHEESEPANSADTSSPEMMTSSPTAAAAARSKSRPVSTGTIGGYETADDGSPIKESFEQSTMDGADEVATPRKPHDQSITSSRTATPLTTKVSLGQEPLDQEAQEVQEAEEAADGDIDDIASDRENQQLKRPKFLRSRQHSQRLSYSSTTTASTDTASDITVGADFALQSGGAVPDDDSTTRSMDLSRTISLGSIASGISDLLEGDGSANVVNADTSFNDGGLAKLDEEDLDYSEIGAHRGRKESSAPATPRATSRSETVIAQHAQTVQVPAARDKELRQRPRASSPDKRAGMPASSIGRSVRGLSLKEQSSTIERLGKENWDLKVKIWCLEKNLNTRSEEGVSELIAANVELRTDKLKLQRELREARRTIRDLERKLKEKEEIINQAKAAGSDKNGGRDANDAEFQEIEAEVTYLRERVETYQVEIEKLRSEGTAREGEKRLLAGVVKNMGVRKSSEADIGVREEMVSPGSTSCSLPPALR